MAPEYTFDGWNQIPMNVRFFDKPVSTGFSRLLPYELGRVHTVHGGHRHVHYDQVGTQQFRSPTAWDPVGRLTAHQPALRDPLQLELKTFDQG